MDSSSSSSDVTTPAGVGRSWSEVTLPENRDENRHDSDLPIAKLFSRDNIADSDDCVSATSLALSDSQENMDAEMMQ